MANDLGSLQMAVLAMYNKRGYTHNLSTLTLGLCEEVGELAAAVLNMLPDFVQSENRSSHDVYHELKDCLVYIMAIANSLGIDLSDIVECVGGD